MKVCLGQINTTPGDFDGNLAAIKRGIDVATEGACDVIVFPEYIVMHNSLAPLLYIALVIYRCRYHYSNSICCFMIFKVCVY